MKSRPAAFTLAILLVCTPGVMAGEYGFHLDYTDGRTALLAGPQDLVSKLSEEHLEKAAANQVFLFTNVAGAHFTWLSQGCGRTESRCELRLNSRGGCRPGADCDFAVQREIGGTVSLQCLRETCRFRVTSNGTQREETLKGHETARFPLGSDFVLSFDGSSVANSDRK